MAPKPISRPAAGLPPGSLIYTGAGKRHTVNVRRIFYEGETFTETDHDTLANPPTLPMPEGVTWLDVDGLHDVELIERVGKGLKIHSLVLEDLLNVAHRPKMEDYDTHLFVTLKMLQWDRAKKKVDSEQVSLVLGQNFVVSFQEKPGDVFEPVRDRLRQSSGRIRGRKADYLLFALVDVIVDHYYAVVEGLGERVAELEEAVFANPNEEQLKDIQKLKRQLLQLRRSVYPVRETLNKLEKEDSGLIQEVTYRYFRDVYDHIIQVIDSLESFRDIVSGLKDTYMSSVSFKMNKVMQVLTIISTIFIPLTFLAGIYGMNFEHMPELGWHYSYAVFWAVILVMAVLLLYFFKRKKWL